MNIKSINFFHIRYIPFAICILGAIASGIAIEMHERAWQLLILFGLLSAIGLYDIFQTKMSILRNYPIIGHLRFMLETIRPEIRQYFLESETEAAPFSRAQRTLVYTRAKGQSDKRPFGTQLDVRAIGYE